MILAYDPRAWFDATAERMIANRGGASELEVVGDLDEFQKRKRHTMLRWLAAREVAGRHLLEVGCGAGGNLRVLHERGAHTEGADISPRMVELARTLNAERGMEFPIVVIDGAHLPHPDASFDVVLTVTALQHNHDGPALDSLSGEIVRVLRPGGAAWIIEGVYPRHTVHRASTHRTQVEWETLFTRHGVELESYMADHSNYPRLMAAWQQLSTAVRKRLLRLRRRSLQDEDDFMRRFGDGAVLDGWVSRGILGFCSVADRLHRGHDALGYYVFRKPSSPAGTASRS
jgi:SAM-dependent methyltransferase